MIDNRSLREKLDDVKKIGCLMGMSVERAMSLTPEEFGYEYEGWKLREEKADRRVARICAVIANVNRNTKKRPEPFTEEDFIPKFDVPEKKTNDELFNSVLAINKAFGGKGGDEICP